MKFLLIVACWCWCLLLLLNKLSAEQISSTTPEIKTTEEPDSPHEVLNNKTIGIRLNSNKHVCLLLSFTKANMEVGFNQTVLYNHTYEMRESEVLSQPTDTHCTVDDIQRLSLKFPDETIVRFEFKLNSTKRTYTLSQLTLEVHNSSLFGALNSSSFLVRSIAPDLKVKPIGRGFSFECKHRYVFRLNETNVEDYKIRLHGLKFWAFRRNSTSSEFKEQEVIFCPIEKKKLKPGNDIIPIAVGGVLTGCLVISLIGYLVIRARKT